jgi:lysophospholipase L1-like esterase
MASAQQPESQRNAIFISCTDAQIVQAPYVWKTLASTRRPGLEAMMPGAYLRATFQGAKCIALVIDGDANAGCPAASMPVIEFSIDERPFETVQLSKTAGEYQLPVAAQLDPEQQHRVEIFYRAADLTNGRWTKTSSRLRLVGFELNPGAGVAPTPVRTKRAIGFGDSITEGVGADGEFTSWQKLEVNNARATWLPMVAAALDAEYGQLGSGGQGMVRGLELPPLSETWSKYDGETSRLKDGRLSPPPDFLFCAMGTNDFDKDITDAYLGWLQEIRNACPQAQVFCIVPPLQVHDREIGVAVERRRRDGDLRVHLVSTASLKNEFRANYGPTRLAHDGVHPSDIGQARLASLIAVEVGRALGRPDAGRER